MKQNLSLLLGFSISLLVSCGEKVVVSSEVGGGNEVKEETPSSVVEELEVLVPPAGIFSTTPVSKEIVKGEQTLSFSLLSSLYTPGASTVFSPLSIQVALGMLHGGATGQTKSEISEVGGFELASAEDVFVYEKGVLEGLSGLENVKASVANMMLSNSSKVSVLPEYADMLKSTYYAPSLSEDFSVDADAVKEIVNTWASRVTEGKIPSLLSEVNPESYGYLMSGLYLKSRWDDPLLTETFQFTHGSGSKEDMTFLVTPGSEAGEPLMYSHQGNYQIVRRTLGGMALAMYIILPDDNDVSGVISSMAEEGWSSIKRGMSLHSVNLSVPSISIENDLILNKTLSDIGMPSVFTDAAELSRMYVGDSRAKVSSFTQKNAFTVDESGLEGATMTVVTTAPTDAPPTDMPEKVEFVADHPFVFIITEERSTGLILYAGVFE